MVTSLFILVALILIGSGCGTDDTPPDTSNGATNETGANQAPVIDTIIPEWIAIERDNTGIIKVVAHDPDGDELTYTWSASRGVIFGDGPTATVTAPSSYVNMYITVTVSDGRGKMAASTLTVPVVCCAEAQRNPEWPE